MIIYGTAILAICHLLGDYLGNTLGMVLGVKANVGGVAISMILLILSKELLAKKGYLPQVTQFGVLYWSGMYIPIVVICAELAGDFHLGYARQLTDKSSLLFDLAF